MKNSVLVIVLLALLGFIAAVSVIGYLQIDKGQKSGEATLVISVFNNNQSHKYKFQNITALDLLELDNAVNVTFSSYGAFVNCVNEICSTSSYYWLYYVNGQMAPVGADAYRVKDKDIVEFRYGKAE
jgi:hypothetical protein